MPFHIESKFSISTVAESKEIASRIKKLPVGSVVRAKSYEYSDVEEKGMTFSTDVELRIISDDIVGVRWKPTTFEVLLRGVEYGFSRLAGKDQYGWSLQEFAEWSTEREVHGKSFLEQNTWNSRFEFPDMFTPFDKVLILLAKIHFPEDYKEKQTKFIYTSPLAS